MSNELEGLNMELREKVSIAIAKSLWALHETGSGVSVLSMSMKPVADAILAIPEIAEALELRAYVKSARKPTEAELAGARRRMGNA